MFILRGSELLFFCCMCVFMCSLTKSFIYLLIAIRRLKHGSVRDVAPTWKLFPGLSQCRRGWSARWTRHCSSFPGGRRVACRLYADGWSVRAGDRQESGAPRARPHRNYLFATPAPGDSLTRQRASDTSAMIINV